MDTGSHILIGVTLGGLAYLDPAVAQNSHLAEAVMVSTIIGSNAPDFDTIVRLKGYLSYIKFHRGVTHSFPALFVWPLLIATGVAFFFDLFSYWLTLYLFSFVATSLHVFLDLLNVYGVQAARPFIHKWLHLDILSIFEPFLFLVHLLGVLLWLFSEYDPGKIFLAVYLISFLYILLRFYQHHKKISELKEFFQLPGSYHLFPDFNFHWFHWRFVVETTDSFYTGRVIFNKAEIENIYPKNGFNPIIEATRKTDGVRAFLNFAQKIYVTYHEKHDGFEVTWSDVRFWYGKKLPFGVKIQLDRNLNVIGEKIAWQKKSWEPPYV